MSGGIDAANLASMARMVADAVPPAGDWMDDALMTVAAASRPKRRPRPAKDTRAAVLLSQPARLVGLESDIEAPAADLVDFGACRLLDAANVIPVHLACDPDDEDAVQVGQARVPLLASGPDTAMLARALQALLLRERRQNLGWHEPAVERAAAAAASEGGAMQAGGHYWGRGVGRGSAPGAAGATAVASAAAATTAASASGEHAASTGPAAARAAAPAAGAPPQPSASPSPAASSARAAAFGTLRLSGVAGGWAMARPLAPRTADEVSVARPRSIAQIPGSTGTSAGTLFVVLDDSGAGDGAAGPPPRLLLLERRADAEGDGGSVRWLGSADLPSGVGAANLMSVLRTSELPPREGSAERAGDGEAGGATEVRLLLGNGAGAAGGANGLAVVTVVVERGGGIRVAAGGVAPLADPGPGAEAASAGSGAGAGASAESGGATGAAAASADTSVVLSGAASLKFAGSAWVCRGSGLWLVCPGGRDWARVAVAPGRGLDPPAWVCVAEVPAAGPPDADSGAGGARRYGDDEARLLVGALPGPGEEGGSVLQVLVKGVPPGSGRFHGSAEGVVWRGGAGEVAAGVSVGAAGGSLLAAVAVFPAARVDLCARPAGGAAWRRVARVPVPALGPTATALTLRGTGPGAEAGLLVACAPTSEPGSSAGRARVEWGAGSVFDFAVVQS